MDVILFYPSPSRGLYGYRRHHLPMGLICVASPLDSLGYHVKIIDQYADPHWKKKLFEALADKPLCFGITSMTGPQIIHGLDACKLVKERNPDLPIVWGGIHATLLPEQTLENPYIDFVVVGEGENTFLELVKALENKGPFDQVLGIGYRLDGKYHFTGHRPFVDLDDQPSPAYHLVDMNRYTESLLGIDHMLVHSSRGCNLDCAFCWDPVMHKRKFRSMDPDKVLDNIRRIVTDYGIRGLIFSDDNFFVDMNWAHNVLERLAKAGLNICIGKLHIRADTLCKTDSDFLNLMVKAGVRRLVMGAESGSQRILDLIKKRITPDQVIEANRKLIPYPIKPAYLFMMGLPTETPEEFAESISLAERLTGENPEATRSFNIYTPYPGTELFGVLLKYGLKVPQRLQDWAGFNYRYLPKETPWIPDETKRLISVLDFALMCGEHDNALGSFKKADPIAVWLSRVYSPLAKYRVKNLDVRFPIELKIIKTLRFLMGRGQS